MFKSNQRRSKGFITQIEYISRFSRRRISVEMKASCWFETYAIKSLKYFVNKTKIALHHHIAIK